MAKTKGKGRVRGPNELGGSVRHVPPRQMIHKYIHTFQDTFKVKWYTHFREA